MSEKNNLGGRKPSADVSWKRQWQCEGGAPDLEADDWALTFKVYVSV